MIFLIGALTSGLKDAVAFVIAATVTELVWPVTAEADEPAEDIDDWTETDREYKRWLAHEFGL